MFEDIAQVCFFFVFVFCFCFFFFKLQNKSVIPSENKVFGPKMEKRYVKSRIFKAFGDILENRDVALARTLASHKVLSNVD